MSLDYSDSAVFWVDSIGDADVECLPRTKLHTYEYRDSLRGAGSGSLRLRQMLRRPGSGQTLATVGQATRHLDIKEAKIRRGDPRVEPSIGRAVAAI